MHRRCAFLTLADRGNYVIDDEHAYAPMAALGWEVEAVPWNDPNADWRNYELVIIRSTWDYHTQTEQFLAVLEKIEAGGTRLENPREVVEWNITKTYLRDLDERGVRIVPTTFADHLEPGELSRYLKQFGSDEIVVKPQVGATAMGAFRLDEERVESMRDEVESYYKDKALMIQPYMPRIASEGEYSLFYFNGTYSHAILKTPKAKDFRSQEEHGAQIKPVEVEDTLLECGGKALEAIGRTLLYARVDFVRGSNDADFYLMELELIEPSLYLRTHPEAPVNFATAITELMK